MNYPYPTSHFESWWIVDTRASSVVRAGDGDGPAAATSSPKKEGTGGSSFRRVRLNDPNLEPSNDFIHFLIPCLTFVSRDGCSYISHNLSWISSRLSESRVFIKKSFKN